MKMDMAKALELLKQNKPVALMLNDKIVVLNSIEDFQLNGKVVTIKGKYRVYVSRLAEKKFYEVV